MAKQINLILDDDVHEAFKMACGVEGISMSRKLAGVVRDIATRYSGSLPTYTPAPYSTPKQNVPPPPLVKVLHPKNQKAYEVTEGLELQQALAKGYTLVEEKA